MRKVNGRRKILIPFVIIFRPAEPEPPGPHWTTWEWLRRTVGPSRFGNGSLPITIALAMCHGDANYFATHVMATVDQQFLQMDPQHRMRLDKVTARMRGYRVLWLRSNGVRIYNVLRIIRSIMLPHILRTPGQHPQYPPPAPPGVHVITLRFHVPLLDIMLPGYDEFCTRCMSLNHSADAVQRCPVVIQ